MEFEYPQWLKWEERDIEDSIRKENYYKYEYGIKNINIHFKEFKESAVYVSKPIYIEGNIGEVSLSTLEHNPKEKLYNKGINPYDSSLEYYITFNDRPTEEDWIPLMPIEKERVDNELLHFGEGRVAKLRFKCNQAKKKSVYKDGVKLNKQFWSLNPDNTVRIDKDFNPYSKYTISYYPDLNLGSPWDINLRPEDKEIVKYRNKDGIAGEVFTNGTNRNGEIRLSRYPYVDYARLESDEDYQPIRVTLESKDDIHGLSAPNGDTLTKVGPTSEKIDGIITKNMTDYEKGNTPNLQPYNTIINQETGLPINPKFEYSHQGRKLCFTETFSNTSLISNQEINHGDANIKVDYEYIRTKARLKIIFRNTSNSKKVITPILRNYNLIFKVVR